MRSVSIFAVFVCLLLVNAETDGAADTMSPQQEQDLEMLNELTSRLVTSLKIVQALRDGPQANKVAEKRRNKFEFIRFGRK